MDHFHFKFGVSTAIYHPQTKLQEGNVFIGVCLPFCWGSHVTPTRDPLDLTVQAPTRCHYTGGSPNTGLATGTLDLTGQGPPATLGHTTTLDIAC